MPATTSFSRSDACGYWDVFILFPFWHRQKDSETWQKKISSSFAAHHSTTDFGFRSHTSQGEVEMPASAQIARKHTAKSYLAVRGVRSAGNGF
jgi:hypothetical protein